MQIKSCFVASAAILALLGGAVASGDALAQSRGGGMSGTPQHGSSQTGAGTSRDCSTLDRMTRQYQDCLSQRQNEHGGSGEINRGTGGGYGGNSGTGGATGGGASPGSNGSGSGIGGGSTGGAGSSGGGAAAGGGAGGAGGGR